MTWPFVVVCPEVIQTVHTFISFVWAPGVWHQGSGTGQTLLSRLQWIGLVMSLLWAVSLSSYPTVSLS